MKILFVVGHLRNYYQNPNLFIDSHLSGFDCDVRFLLTHKEIGWWTGERDKTVEIGEEQVMLSKINEDSFFDKVNFLDITRREETMSKYNVLAINPERSYYREPSVKVQVVHRYLAMQQLNTLCTVSDDDTIILTRPDILPKNRSMIPIMNKTIDEFCYDSKKEILLFYHGGIPHDCIIVGKKKSLNQLFSPKVYNTNKYAQAHENLDNMVKMFNTTRVLVPDSYYYANSPNMKQY